MERFVCASSALHGSKFDVRTQGLEGVVPSLEYLLLFQQPDLAGFQGQHSRMLRSEVPT